MAEKTDNKKLFEDFPPVSSEDWRAKIEKDLKGTDFERKLVWRTQEGFSVQPFYRSEDLDKLSHLDVLPGEFPYVRSKKTSDNSWHIRQDIDARENVEAANKKALDVLMKGATSLGFILNEEKNYTKEDIQKLLENVFCESIETNFLSCKSSPEILKYFLELLKDNNRNLQKVEGSVDYDPIGNLTLTGNFYDNDEAKSIEEARQMILNSEALPNFRLIAVNGKHFNNAGATAVEELAFSLATANEYLSKLTDRGLAILDVAPRIKFNFGIGSNYFMEIAKFRAARLLWALLIEQYHPNKKETAQIHMHAETSMWNKTLYDPYVNMLRTTTEGMSATVAGIDSMAINPFDRSYQTPNKFSERIARNQQLILKEEAHFDKVIDPAGGSYYIEELTDAIAEHAWNLFREIEKKGGYIEAFKEGFIQERIKETTQKRDIAIATRKESLLGTNQFPNNNEVADKFVSFDIIKSSKPDTSNAIAEPIKLYRGAEAFEVMRLKTDRSDKRPLVFMLTIGNLAMRKARAQFSSSFFACAGFEIKDNLGFESVEEGVKAAKKADADIVVVCSSDDEYAEYAPAAYEELKGKAIVVVAGYPKAIVDELKAKDVQHFIHMKSNVLEELKGFQKELGIE